MSALTHYPAPVREYASAAEMQAAARKLKARMFAGPAEPVEPKAPRFREVPVRAFQPIQNEPAPVRPWRPKDDREAELVRDWQNVTIQVPTGPIARARSIMREVADEHGFSVAELRNDRRAHKLVFARRAAIARVYVECPELSLPAIGRLFAKDHTSVINACEKAGVYRKRCAEIFEMETE